MSSEMLREVSDSLFEFLIEAFPTNQSYSRADIEQDPMPPLMAHFLGQTLQHRLEDEIEHFRTVRSKWFDYDHAEVENANKAFIEALAQHSRIPSEEWRGTLKRATKLVIAHLILPTHTLVEFVFRDDEGPLSATEIYRQLSYFAAYPYLREAIGTFLKKRELAEMDRTRFSSLLSQIDRHMTSSYTSDEWLRMLRPLFDLMRRVPQTRKQGIPIDLLGMFFGDKEAYEIQERLQVEKEVHRLSSINEESLRRVIEGSVGPFEQHLTQVAPPASPKPVGATTEAPSLMGAVDEDATVHLPFVHNPAAGRSADPARKEAPDRKSDDESSDDSNGPRPLWKQFQKGPEIPAPSTATNGESSPEKPKKEGPVPLWKQFQQPPGPESKGAGPVTPKAGAAGLSMSSSSFKSQQGRQNNNNIAQRDDMVLSRLETEVLGLRGSSNRNMFIDDLFSGSSDAYERFLNQLKQISDWTHASRFIAEEVFKKHKVDIYSPAAVAFTESVEGQFRQR